MTYRNLCVYVGRRFAGHATIHLAGPVHPVQSKAVAQILARYPIDKHRVLSSSAHVWNADEASLCNTGTSAKRRRQATITTAITTTDPKECLRRTETATHVAEGTATGKLLCSSGNRYEIQRESHYTKPSPEVVKVTGIWMVVRPVSFLSFHKTVKRTAARRSHWWNNHGSLMGFISVTPQQTLCSFKIA